MSPIRRGGCKRESRVTTRQSWRSARINHLDAAGPSQLKRAEGCSENGFDLGHIEVEPLLVGRCDQRTALGFFLHYCRQMQSKMLGNLSNLFWCEHHALHSSGSPHRGALRVLDLEPCLPPLADDAQQEKPRARRGTPS